MKGCSYYQVRHYSPHIGERDKKKVATCQQLGINLITVPYWWDGSLSSLAATIRQARPDIEIPSVDITAPIPLNVPIKATSSVPFEVKHAGNVPEKFDVTGW